MFVNTAVRNSSRLRNETTLQQVEVRRASCEAELNQNSVHSGDFVATLHQLRRVPGALSLSLPERSGTQNEGSTLSCQHKLQPMNETHATAQDAGQQQS